MIGRDVRDVEALHHTRGACELELLTEFCEVSGGFDGGWDAATACELAAGSQSFLKILKNVAESGGFFEIEHFGGGGHFRSEFVEDFTFPFSF